MVSHPAQHATPPGGTHTPDSCPLGLEFKVEQGRREVAKWLLSIGVALAIAIGGWAHARLASDADRLTRLEAQRDGDKTESVARWNEVMRRLDELRDLVKEKRP